MKAILKSLGYMLFYILFQIIVMSIIAIGLQVSGRNVDIEPLLNNNSMVFASISNVLTILLLIIFFKICKKSLQKELHITRIKLEEYILPCILAFLFSFVFSLITYNMEFENTVQIKAGMEYYSAMLPGLGIAIQVITLLIISPITEEIIFRGLILTTIQKQYNNVAAVLLSGLFFGFIHFMAGGVVLVLGATAMGIIFGIIYVKTKSLLPVIAAHSIANTADFVMAMLPQLSKAVQYILIAIFSVLFIFTVIKFVKKCEEKK